MFIFNVIYMMNLPIYSMTSVILRYDFLLIYVFNIALSISDKI